MKKRFCFDSQLLPGRHIGAALGSQLLPGRHIGAALGSTDFSFLSTFGSFSNCRPFVNPAIATKTDAKRKKKRIFMFKNRKVQIVFLLIIIFVLWRVRLRWNIPYAKYESNFSHRGFFVQTKIYDMNK